MTDDPLRRLEDIFDRLEAPMPMAIYASDDFLEAFLRANGVTEPPTPLPTYVYGMRVYRLPYPGFFLAPEPPPFVTPEY